VREDVGERTIADETELGLALGGRADLQLAEQRDAQVDERGDVTRLGGTDAKGGSGRMNSGGGQREPRY